jgi:hypothetical protein
MAFGQNVVPVLLRRKHSTSFVAAPALTESIAIAFARANGGSNRTGPLCKTPTGKHTTATLPL